jgi:hypothetical protein
MPRVRLVESSGNDQIVERVFKEVISAEGEVDRLSKLLANYPPALLTNWERTKALMYSGNLSIQLKHEIATLISKEKNCHS